MTNEECLKSVWFFSVLTDSEIKYIGPRCRRRTYAAGNQIIWKDEQGSSLYIIDTGKVLVHITTDFGANVNLNILDSAKSFGDLGVLGPVPRGAHITAVERTECVILDNETLLTVFREFPKLAIRIMANIVKTMGEQNGLPEVYGNRDLGGRVAMMLHKLSVEFGVPWTKMKGIECDPDAVRISTPLSKNDFMNLVGARREQVSHILTDFVKAGYITTDLRTNHLVLLRPAAITKRAGIIRAINHFADAPGMAPLGVNTTGKLRKQPVAANVPAGSSASTWAR